MASREVDPFTLEICRSRLDSIVREMATALIRTSSSPTTTETKDFSCSLFDHMGRQLSFAGYILYHASSNWEGIEVIRREYPLEEIDEGDVFIANDPCYGGGIHPGDVCVFQPHFFEGKIVAWLGQSTRLSIRGVGGVDPVARSLRSPELHRRSEPEYHENGNRRRRRRPHHRLERVEQHRAAQGQNAPSRSRRPPPAKG